MTFAGAVADAAAEYGFDVAVVVAAAVTVDCDVSG